MGKHWTSKRFCRQCEELFKPENNCQKTCYECQKKNWIKRIKTRKIINIRKK